MLVSVNDVANRLKISNRAVQIKCKRAGLVKIGNQYQITQDIADEWADNSEAKQRSESEHTPTSSHPKRKDVRSFDTVVILFLLLMLCAIAYQFYINLDTQITVANDTIKKNDTEHKEQIKDLNKRLNDAGDVIHSQELEIQSLKFKDSIRFIKW